MSESSVIMNLWKYLLALETDERRFKFVQNVYNREFDVDLLKYGREIWIQAPFGSEIKYYEFVVKYLGEVAQKGKGNYISLQLKNKGISLTGELKTLSQYYQFAGTGIVVPADWIMVNLYKKDKERQLDSHINTSKVGDSTPVDMVIDGFALGAIPKHRRQLDETAASWRTTTSKPPNLTTEFKLINNNNELGAAVEKRVYQSSLPIEHPKKFSENGAISSFRRLTETRKYADEIDLMKKTDEPVKNIDKPLIPSRIDFDNTTNKPQNYADEIQLITNVNGAVKNFERTKCDLCSKTVEIHRGVILRECLHSFCTECMYAHIEHNSNYSGIRCPYSKEYECDFDLLDAEIKDLGGDSIYNKILDNRLKEYVGSDPNARVCFNENCNNVWVSPRTNERCLKCKMYSCLICNTAYNGLTRHVHKSKTNNEANKNLIKEKCLSNTVSTDSKVLGKSLKYKEKIEQIKIQKSSVGDNRKKRPGAVDDKKRPIIGKCQVCSKRANLQLKLCEHLFCYNCLQALFKDQVSDSKKNSINCIICKESVSEPDILRYGNKQNIAKYMSKIESANCGDSKSVHADSRVVAESLKCEEMAEQRSNQNISAVDNRIKRPEAVGAQGKLVFENCQTCSNRADMQLTQCQHFFCNRCIQNLMKNQALDPNNICINCIACNEPVSESDIILYGNKQIFDLIKLKIDAAKRVLTPVDQLSVSGSKVLVECLKCEENFGEDLIQICTKCASAICLKCAKSTITGQIANNCPIICLFCQILLEQSQIDQIINADTEGYLRETISCKDTVDSNLVELPFKCLRCKQSVDRPSQIILTDCKHQVCQNCLRECISVQMIRSSVPRCPICQEQIDQIQLKIIGFGLDQTSDSAHLEKRPAFKKPTCTDTDSGDNDLYICAICQQSVGVPTVRTLLYCKDRFCCACIVKALSDQSITSKIPSCPKCKREVASTDILELCGREGFKRYMDNKRKK